MAIKETCEGILKYIGGEENITNVYHCATRLRFTVKNPEHVDLERMEKVDKVLGTMHQGDTYQIVLGPGADQYYHQFIQLGNFAALGEVPEETERLRLLSRTSLSVLSTRSPAASTRSYRLSSAVQC